MYVFLQKNQNLYQNLLKNGKPKVEKMAYLYIKFQNNKMKVFVFQIPVYLKIITSFKDFLFVKI